MTVFFAAAFAGIFATDAVFAGDPGLFRTRLADAPERGVLRASSTSFYSGIPVNDILKTQYGVTDAHIFSSMFTYELGVTDFLTFDGSLPYYMDRFKQGDRAGKKTGAGDVVLGLRYSRVIPGDFLSGFSVGTHLRIAEQLGYGPEPLGFRTFSYGKPAYSIDLATGFHLPRMDMNVSLSLLRFPNAAQADSAYATDAFYDTGFGYMGIGRPDQTGLAEGLFQNQFHTSVGLSMLLEFSSTSFVGEPGRDGIMTLAPAVRLGTTDGL
ncbi:hypothetical protein ACFL5H_00385, partial [Candidatus Latescibacterota bacterium]